MPDQHDLFGEVEVTQEKCPHCGGSVVEYKHGLTGIFHNILKSLQENNGILFSSSARLTFSERANAQKLQYWNLMRSDGSGLWRLTEAGHRFVDGFVKVQKYAHTVNGKVVRRSGPMVSFEELSGPTQTRPEYQEQKRKSLSDEV